MLIINFNIEFKVHSIEQKIYTTLKREGIKSLVLKGTRRLKYKFQRIRYHNIEYEKDWASLKNKYNGERAFLIGNGPSLNKTPLYLLQNEYTMCFNRFYLMNERLNWNPSFYMSVDNLVLDDIIDEVDSITENVKHSFFPDIHFRGKKYFDKIEDRDNLHWIKQIHGQGFSTSLPKAYIGGSVIYEGLQVLSYLGFKDIYLIGVDMSFQNHNTAKDISGKETDIISQADDDPNHFDPRYFGKKRKYHQPKDYVINFIISNLEYLSGKTKELNLEIINVGYDSKLKCFPRNDYMTLFDYSVDQKEALLNNCFKRNTSFASMKDFELASIKLSDVENLHDGISHFRIPANDAFKIINKYIFSHIPIGPYNNQYYFVKRKN